MRRIALAVALLIAAVPLVANALAATTVAGTVGPGFTITLKQGSQRVTSLRAAKVTFKIDDRSGSHNFHLTGPGVNKKTTVAEVGKKTWELTLRKGTYRFVCDPHALRMKSSFTVK